MSFYRLSVVLLAIGIATPSCTSCGRAPVKNTLKPDGEACGTDEECESSLCDKLPGKSNICFKKCAAGCKAGDICTALATNDRFACVPEKPGLCQPCALNVDCPYPGDRCLEIGGTKVCARDCSFDGQCPSSYRCADGTDTNGAFVTKQCQPTSGTCECTAVSAGQTTPCQESNAIGTCTGVRTCRPPNGYEACTAPVPTTESCNGRDDDCNGMTDENLGETTCGTGECRRTVTNCINGSPQTCEPGTPGTEICDEKDNNCNGVVDEGFDKMTSLVNCGTCGNACVRPHATPLCMGGMCGIGACDVGWVNADAIDMNGCEYNCTPTGAELCDGIDNNCNGVVDEGFATAADPLNCGQCGRVCNVNNGHISAYACVASSCGIMTCSAGFADCDQSYGTGCEKNVASDINNCGACNTVCTTTNGTPGCASSACTVASCNTGWGNCDNQVPNGCEQNTTNSILHCGGCGMPCATPAFSTPTCAASTCGFNCLAGHVDLDGVAANGCEYACTATGADVPELTFADANCDGIDGDASQAIFVSTTGNDGAAGTRAAPKRTITVGISAAAASSKGAVYVSKGIYNEAVVMVPGVSLYGGYDSTANWSRALANTTTIASPTAVGVLAQNISIGVEIQLLTITSSNASGTDASGSGRSSIGIHILNSAAGVTVLGCNVTAGNGSAGANGVAGTTGTIGGTGGAAIGSAQGAGGSSSCGAPGGQGGAGVSGTSNGNGGTGGTQAPGGGSAGNPGSGGAAGVCNSTTSSDGSPAPPVTAGGSPGNVGANGVAGSAVGSISAGLYVPASGNAGGSGAPGGGAGGGGSGGGTAHGTNIICTNCSNISSGGGGGGGGGGCGGSAGTPGKGGGASFAILVVNSVATVTNTTMRSNNGGNGGPGGAGGPGGGGGPVGPGAAGANANNSCSNRSGGAGANGAQGGAGGQGGGASGGAGGPTVCVAYNGTAPTTSNLNCTNGTIGSGGIGGTNGLMNAASGAPGIANTIQAF